MHSRFWEVYLEMQSNCSPKGWFLSYEAQNDIFEIFVIEYSCSAISLQDQKLNPVI